MALRKEFDVWGPPRNRAAWLLVVAVIVPANLPRGHAEPITWGGGTGSYSTGANWVGGVAPTASNQVVIAAGTAQIFGSDGGFARGAATTISGGRLELSNLRFRNAEGGPATFEITSGSLVQTGSTYFLVGHNNAGVFNQSGGTVAPTLSRGFFTSDQAGSSGVYNLTGGSLSVTMNGTYNTDLHNVQIGRTSGSDRFLVDGGTAIFNNTAGSPTDRRFYIFRDAEFEVRTGVANVDNFHYFVVGRNAAAGATSKAIFSGGTTSIAVRDSFILNAGTNARVDVSGGSLSISPVGGSGGHLVIGDRSDGLSLFHQTGGIVTVSGDVLLNRVANATLESARYVMDGGELEARDILRSNPNGLFTLSQGTIRLTLGTDRRGILDEPWFVLSPGTTATASFNDGVTTIVAVPEPAGWLLLAVGVAGVAVVRRRVPGCHTDRVEAISG